MKMRPRIYYTEEQKAMMWDRWQKGESLSSIARLFDRYHSSIERIIREHGGIRPPERRRSPRALTLPEREEISRGIATGSSIRSIAASLSRAPSTISREIKRNGDQRRYRASQADQAAWDRAHRPKICKLAENRALARIVARKLQLEWSPEQIAGWLKHTPGRRAISGVTRNHLSQSLYPGTWCLEEGAIAAFEANPHDAPLTSPHAKGGGSRSNYRHGIDP